MRFVELGQAWHVPYMLFCHRDIATALETTDHFLPIIESIDKPLVLGKKDNETFPDHMRDIFFRFYPEHGYARREVTLFDDKHTMAHIVHGLGLFESISDARKNGWNKPIPRGPSIVAQVSKKDYTRLFFLNKT
jgi:hypothetical protein